MSDVSADVDIVVFPDGAGSSRIPAGVLYHGL